MGATRVRAVAVYIPHGGYDVACLYDTCDVLREALLEGRRKGCRLVVGGDFNTQLSIGSRGDLLEEICECFGLAVANDGNNAEEWTFQSSLGVRRRPDYILLDRCLLIRAASPFNYFDMGSDHRAVRAHICGSSRKKFPRGGNRIRNPKGWRPRLGHRHQPAEFPSNSKPHSR